MSLPMRSNNEDNFDDTPSSPILYSSVIHGPSGEYFDIVNPNCRLPDLKEGD